MKILVSFVIGLLSTLLVGCKLSQEKQSSEQSAIPGTTRNAWMLSPEEIHNTVTQTWGLALTKEESNLIFSMQDILGGTIGTAFGATTRNPNKVYMGALSKMSHMIAKKMIENALTLKPGDGGPFSGLKVVPDDKGCFDNNRKFWCDFDDRLHPHSLSAVGLTKAMIDASWAKRIMHNIQDIAEYMFVKVDNQVWVKVEHPKKHRKNRLFGRIHAPRLLLKRVFLPELEALGPISAEAEQRAWEKVVYVVLIGSGFYIRTGENL